MQGLGLQLNIALRLHFRNKMALLYGYLFPAMFVLAFWVLYRYDRVPLVLRIAELLTIAILGGACFGLPTTMVSERERGVWRRYRLAPVAIGSLVTSTVIARYLLLLTAGLLQLVLAMAVGMPLPKHVFDLWLAYTLVSFAFIGMGLVIATLADNVPAVQALGQCIFLPMLIIGGIAVPLQALPEWAQHASAFFPGRYAVEALRATVTGDGIGTAGFSLLALLVIGAAGCVAGAKMFRWDAQQRFAARTGKGWLAAALSAWVVVGLVAESRGFITITSPDPPQSAAQTTAPPQTSVLATAPVAAVPTTPAPPVAQSEMAGTPVSSSPAPPALPPAAITPPSAAPPSPTAAAPAAGPPRRTTLTIPSDPAATSPAPAKAPTSWQAVTVADIDAAIRFDRLPPDSGIVTPIAKADDEPDQGTAAELGVLSQRLVTWAPGYASDPVQRTRNLLFVAGAIDVFQSPTERFVPAMVFQVLEEAIPKDDLVKVLYWIALHPDDGTNVPKDDLLDLGLEDRPVNIPEMRSRAATYSVKLLGRLLGRIKPD